MKKIFLIIAILITAVNSFAQPITPEKPMTKEDYMLKSKSLKKTSTIMLIAGAGLMGTALIIPAGEVESNSGGFYPITTYKNDAIRGIIFVLGMTSAIISFPLRHASKKNLRKAESLGLKMEKIADKYKPAYVSNSFPALSFKIKF